ncbi:MAG: hypothetical protein R6V75_06870 [Bacteroidales bacterium]
MRLTTSRIRRMGLFLAAMPLMLLTACGEHSAIVEETFRFADANRGWAPAEERGESFIMIDDNGISQSFTQAEHSSYFTKSWSSILGINTHMSHIEYTHCAWYSTFGTAYSQSLTAGSQPHGDRLYAGVDGVNFEYDLENQVIIRMDTPFGYLSRIMTETGYRDGDPIGSTVEHIEVLTVGDQAYTDVIRFTLNDFRSEWTPRTVTEIYLAKGIGLIRFVRSSGVGSERV